MVQQAYTTGKNEFRDSMWQSVDLYTFLWNEHWLDSCTQIRTIFPPKYCKNSQKIPNPANWIKKESILWSSEWFISTWFFMKSPFLGFGVLCVNHAYNCLNWLFEYCFRSQNVSRECFLSSSSSGGLTNLGAPVQNILGVPVNDVIMFTQP